MAQRAAAISPRNTTPEFGRVQKLQWAKWLGQWANQSFVAANASITEADDRLKDGAQLALQAAHGRTIAGGREFGHRVLRCGRRKINAPGSA